MAQIPPPEPHDGGRGSNVRLSDARSPYTPQRTSAAVFVVASTWDTRLMAFESSIFELVRVGYKPVVGVGSWALVPDPLAGRAERDAAIEALGDLITPERWPLVEELTNRPVLCRLVSWHWEFAFYSAARGSDDFEVDHLDLIRELSEMTDQQLEVLEGLLSTWDSTIFEAMDVARRLT